MSSLDTLKTRLEYHGGSQEGRMITDKAKALKKALLYSYQACTAVLKDGREFRCLINSDKLKMDYEDKIISIPFYGKRVGGNAPENSKDVANNIPTVASGEEEIGMRPGDTFQWKENNTMWLVYLQRIEEDAYFRAEIRRCRYSFKIGKTDYPIYMSGPSKNTIAWHTKKDLASWNDIDYNSIMYITKNAETEDFFHRFTIIKINNKPWEVQMVDSVSTEGIIEIKLKEYYSNTIEDEVLKEESVKPIQPKPQEIYIEGPAAVYPYDIIQYNIKNAEQGHWEISNNKAIITEYSSNDVTIEIVTGHSGSFILTYKTLTQEIQKEIQIESL